MNLHTGDHVFGSGVSSVESITKSLGISTHTMQRFACKELGHIRVTNSAFASLCLEKARDPKNWY